MKWRVGSRSKQENEWDNIFTYMKTKRAKCLITTSSPAGGGSGRNSFIPLKDK